MSDATRYGPLTPHAVGTLMKEAVRRALVAIRQQRFTFEAAVKGTSPSGSPDFVTTADHAAQRVLVRLLREWFPGYGIVAEEDQLAVPCRLEGLDAWFTVDPLDGTKAFMRRQSHGIGTMLALVVEGRVVAACVGDVMTQEVYALRPEGEHVYRVSEFGIAEPLSIDTTRPLIDQWALLTAPPERLTPLARALVAGDRPLFAGYEISVGSIGIAAARQWKGEVGGMLLRPTTVTPWDFCPLLGISRALDFVFLGLDHNRVVPFEPLALPELQRFPRETLVLHRSRLGELEAWRAARGAV